MIGGQLPAELASEVMSRHEIWSIWSLSAGELAR